MITLERKNAMKMIKTINIYLFEFLIIWTLVLLTFFGNSISELSEMQNVKGLRYPLLAILLVVVFCAIDLWKGEELERLLSSKSSFFVFISLLCVAVFKLYISYGAFFHSGWDVRTIRWTVEYIITGAGPEEYIISYYSWYPNNLLMIWIYKMIALLCNKFDFISWEYGVVILNNLLSVFALYLVYRITFILTKKYRVSLCTYIYALVFVGVSPWCIITYSDSLCFAFPIISIYLFILFKKHRNNILLRFLYAILLGSVSCLGLFIKPQVFIVYISIVIFEVMGFLIKKESNCLLLLSTSFISFLLFSILISKVCIPSLNLEIDNEKSMGWQHYLMMGLNEETVGAYSESDVYYSRSFDTRKERNKNDLIEAGKRLENMGFPGLINHINRKEMLNYGYGTFAWGWEGAFWEDIPDWAYNRISVFARKFIMPDGEYYLFFQKSMNFLWLTTLILCSFIGMNYKKMTDDDLIVNIIILSIIGLTVFLLIFEPRARYMFTYSPLFIVLAGIGYSNIFEKLKRFYGKLVSATKNKNSII